MQHAAWWYSDGWIARVVVGTGLLLAIALSARGQQAMPQSSHGMVPTEKVVVGAVPVATTEEALRAMADEAAVIFAGEVLTVRAEGAAMRVDIRVDDGIRGVKTGEVYVLREWVGLWTAGAPRYRVGERALLLLHAPSAAGWSSPVGGGDGLIPLSGDAIAGSADLRWVAARVLRTVGTRAEIGGNAVATARLDISGVSMRAAAASSPEHPVSVAVQIVQPVSASVRANGIAWPADAREGNVLGPDLHAIDRSLVTGLLRVWTGGMESR